MRPPARHEDSLARHLGVPPYYPFEVICGYMKDGFPHMKDAFSGTRLTLRTLAFKDALFYYLQETITVKHAVRREKHILSAFVLSNHDHVIFRTGCTGN